MATCRACGGSIPDTAAVCPYCGQSISTPPPIPEQPSYGGYTAQSQQQQYMPPPQQQYMPPQQQYMPPQQQYMPPQQGGVNVTVVNTGAQQSKTGLIVEIILSIFGIYGVGWLISGETTVGIILLICSFVLYYPAVIVLGIFTVGLCDIPLVLGAIILNAVMLNNALNRKAAQQITVVQTR